ncbi:formylglycine-generating enzyme family protein [Candidatus Foliamicus sp.]
MRLISVFGLVLGALGNDDAGCGGRQLSGSDHGNVAVISGQQAGGEEQKADGHGLHDMHGNATKWVQDCWNESYEVAPENGSAWETGACSRRIVRGCSYGDHPPCLRSASRAGIAKTGRSPVFSFRVARALAPSTPE